MAAAPMVAGAPRSTPIALQAPEPKPSDFWTGLQWEVFESLIDTVVPSIVVSSDSQQATGTNKPDLHRQLVISEQQCNQAYDELVRTLKSPPTYEQFKAFLANRPLDNPRFHKHLRRVVGGTPTTVHKKLGGALNLFTRRSGSLIATGYWTPLHQQPLHVREGILQSWNTAWTAVWPTLSKTFCTLGRVSWAPTDPTFHQLSGYTDHPEDYQPGSEVDYKFRQFPAHAAQDLNHDAEPDTNTITIKTDIVIVGSGCGGGVAAKVLSEAGYKVIVVDKGYYFPPSHLPMAAEAGQQFLFESAGATQSQDGALSLLAGSCWGGGGTINWSAALEPQDFVRREWVEKDGLAFFGSEAFQESIERVSSTMGVSEKHVRQNHGNRVLLDGAERLGWKAKAVPQNTGGNEHFCGRCSLGCGAGEKQGPAVCWLPAAQRAGAEFIEGFACEKVVFDDEDGERKAVGVVGTWTARDQDGFVHSPAQERLQRVVRIEAKKVILSAGSLNSPLLLMRSGLENPHIGKNLHVHPCGLLTAAFPDEVKGWEGGILTSVVSDFENLDGEGHGVKLEATSMLPHMVLFNLPWHSALQWKTDALKYRQMNSYIAIARDRDTGSVVADPHDGRPIVNYTISDLDRAHTLQGLVALAKLCYVQGATDIWPAVPGVPTFKRHPGDTTSSSSIATTTTTSNDENGEEDNDPLTNEAFQSWLRILEAADNCAPRTQHGSAHQMGTCRMSSSPEEGVVDPSGKVWGVNDLYVADASVFPSASGVNPMITVMAVADWIARGLVMEMKGSEGK